MRNSNQLKLKKMKTQNRLILSIFLLCIIVACTKDNIIYPTAATAGFSIPVEEHEIGKEILLTDLSVPNEGTEIVGWEWDFGSSSIPNSTDKNPKVIYHEESSYQITLSVTDNNGLKASVSKNIQVIDPSNNLRIVWEKPLADAVQNTVSPAMSPDEKTVYMIADRADANGDLKLFAYNAENGDIKWEYNIDRALSSLNTGGNPRIVYCSPSVGSDGTVFFAVRDLQSPGANRKSFLFAVSPNGTAKWQYAFGYDVNFNYLTVAIGNDGNIYAGGLTNTPYNVVVLNSSDGTEIKRIESPVGIRTGLALSKDGDVYFASTGANGVYGYNIVSSTQKFNYSPGGLSSTGGDFTIGSDGTIFTTSTIGSNGGVLAINADGSEKWVYKTEGGIDFGGVAIGTYGTLYAAGGRIAGDAEKSDGLVALNTDGTLKWKFETNEAVTNCVPLVDNRDYIHFVTDSGTYYVVKDDGSISSTISLGVRSFSSPVMDASGKVYIASEKILGTSTMICLTSRGADGPANSAWPMKGQNSQRTHLQK
jgi:hypothetical protein